MGGSASKTDMGRAPGVDERNDFQDQPPLLFLRLHQHLSGRFRKTQSDDVGNELDDGGLKIQKSVKPQTEKWHE